MARALLINPGFDLGTYKKRGTIVFPFGLGYIASYAEKHGHQIKVWDILGTKLGFEEVKRIINDLNFSDYDIIGITGIVTQFSYVKQLSELIREKTDVKLVLGGPLSTYSWDIILKYTNIDICVIGEGEQTFLDLLNSKQLNSIDGIAFKVQNDVIKTKDRDMIKNIDDIGFPAFHLFDMETYIKSTKMFEPVGEFLKHKRILPLFTSRGCPYNCKFCSKSTKGIRMKSLDFLFKEVEYYIKNFKIDAIHFIDELLLLNKKRFINFCIRIKKYDILWDCQGRINLTEEKLLKYMKAANGICIGFGIESGSQKILDAMDKKIKASDIRKILLSCLSIRVLF